MDCPDQVCSLFFIPGNVVTALLLGYRVWMSLAKAKLN